MFITSLSFRIESLLVPLLEFFARVACLGLAAVVLAAGMTCSTFAEEKHPPNVSVPLDSFFEIVSPRHRQAAREFYRKHLSIDGLSVVASEEVADEALVRTRVIVQNMLSGRPDVLRRMVEEQMYLIIIGKDQKYTDMPEYRDVRNKEYMNERVRGTGGKPTSFGEENLLSLALDRYDDESIAVHEFAHTIDGTLHSMDSTWGNRLRAAYRDAIETGKYKGAYASSNPGEYWGEIVQAYFDCNRVNNWNHGPIGDRESLRQYDPKGFQLVESTFKIPPDNHWRYEYLTRHPTVIAPPERFSIDPYYKKFSWAREFVIVSRTATDEQLVDANQIIRHLFAYRHDILKTLINRDAKLVVLGQGETLVDLPEWESLKKAGIEPNARFVEFAPATNLIVVDGAEVTQTSGTSNGLGNPVIASMTDAFLKLTADREIDPNWENRGRDVQQYELNVTRLDKRFGRRVRNAWKASRQDGLWDGVPMLENESDYLCAGVLAYFDADSTTLIPKGSSEPVNNRQALQQYDPNLYELVHELMAYQDRTDWRITGHDSQD